MGLLVVAYNSVITHTIRPYAEFLSTFLYLFED